MSADDRYLDMTDFAGHRITVEGHAHAPLVTIQRHRHPDRAYRAAHPRSAEPAVLTINRDVAWRLRDALSEFLDDEARHDAETAGATA